MEIFLGVLVGLIVLTFLVAIHELGHAMAAKRNGVKLEEFAIGFPPKIKTFKTKTDKILPKDTPISINLLPLGGFVRLQGECDEDNSKGDYGKATFWGKTQILFAGVAMNWLVAILFFTVVALMGAPNIIPNQFYLKNDAKISTDKVFVAEVVQDSSAQKAGIEKGDELKSIAGEKVANINLPYEIAKKHAGEKVDFEIVRKNETKKIEVSLNEDKGDNSPIIGMSSAGYETIRSTWSAPIVGVGLTAQITTETFKGIGSMFYNAFTGYVQKILNHDSKIQEKADEKIKNAGENLAGPVSILGVIFPQTLKGGLPMILFIAAIISVSLACMNVLPIPALDGGRWFLTFIFRKILKKPLSKEVESRINFYGFLVIIALSILVLILDIKRF